MEETNARYVKSLPEPVSLVTIDASFISLKILLPVVKGWLSSFSSLPIFEENGVTGCWLMETSIRPWQLERFATARLATAQQTT